MYTGNRFTLTLALAGVLVCQACSQQPQVLPDPLPVQALGLDQVAQLALERHPRLQQAGLAVEVARGRADQAGRYPNPMLLVEGQQVTDIQAMWTAPFFSQEIVTGGKRRLSREAAFREVDQATLKVYVQRFNLLTAVRQNYFDVLTLQRRSEILGELVQLAEKSVDGTRKLFDNRQAARIDLLQLELELEKIQAERDAAARELPGAFRRLAAGAGVPDLPSVPLLGSLETPLPEYDLEVCATHVRAVHPEVQSARVGIDKASLLLRRATVERTPNVTVGAGYMRQNQGKSNDWGVTVTMPIPLWNRNQGNIRAAQAEYGEAVAEVGRVESELTERLAMAHREYASAKQKAERYRTAIMPRAKETYDLSLQAFRGGQFDLFKVLQAQRALAEANLEYVKTLGESWKAAGALAGLLLEEAWPVVPAVGK